MKRTMPKYSAAFYKRSLLLSVAAIAVFSLFLFSVFSLVLYRNNIAYARKSIASENEDSYARINEVLENCTRICMFFSSYKIISPVFQAQADVDLRRATLQEEVTTFTSCFDYIAGLQVDTGEYIVRSEDKSGETKNISFVPTMAYKTFEVGYTPGTSWPHFLQIKYTSLNGDSFTVSINIHLKYLSQHHINKNSYCIADDGTILIAEDTSLLGENISDITDISLDLLLGKEKVPHYIKSVRNIDNSGLTVLTLQTHRSAQRVAYPQIFLLFLACLCILSIGILLIDFTLRKVYRPIEKVTQIFKYYLPEDKTFAEDDVRFISECIGDKDMDAATRAGVLQIRKSQLHILHAQISPHFLGNSLDVLKWETVKQLGVGNPIEQSLGILSMFLSETQQYTRMFATIQEEIERTKQYLKLVTYCFNEHLQVVWTVDENTLNYSIVSLTLQPLIENSIFHGFAYPKDDAQICVSIVSKGENIRITLKDNGSGMEPKVLEDLLKALSDDEPTNRHIGIKNTHLKLKLLYGPDYGVTSIQSDTSGTTMELLIPKYIYPLTKK